MQTQCFRIFGVFRSQKPSLGQARSREPVLDVLGRDTDFMEIHGTESTKMPNTLRISKLAM